MRTDIAKAIVTVRNFVNATKKDNRLLLLLGWRTGPNSYASVPCHTFEMLLAVCGSGQCDIYRVTATETVCFVCLQSVTVKANEG